jgi:hypothetical protein
MSPKEIYIQTLEQQTAVLKKLGCDYKIKDHFGNVHQNKKCITRPKVYSWIDLRISEQIRAAQPGDELVFEAKGRPLRALSSVVSGKANKILGGGKHRVSQNTANGTVVLIILGQREVDGLDAALTALGIK